MFVALFATLSLSGCFFGNTVLPYWTVTSVTVSCSSNPIFSNQTDACSTKVNGTGNYSEHVAWSVSPAGMGTISAEGLFKPAMAGTALITATADRDSAGNVQAGSQTITVAVPITITGVTVSCSPASILTNQTSVCVPNVSGTGNYSNAVAWSVAPSGVGTISGAGVFTPAGAGTATITATSIQDPSKSASTNVAVAVPITITSVSVSALPSTITSAQTATCTATVSGTGNFSSSVTWGATGGTITPAGMLTPSGAGTATCTAVSNQDPSVSGVASINVTEVPKVSSVSVSCNSVAVPVSQSGQCSATVTGTGPYSSQVNWSVNGVQGGNSTVGTVSSSGVYTAPAVVPTPFTVTIGATSSEDVTRFAMPRLSWRA